MLRNTAREIAIHLSYELSFNNTPIDTLLDQRLTAETFSALAEEDPVYAEAPNAKQAAYIRRLARGWTIMPRSWTAIFPNMLRAGTLTEFL